MKLSQFLAFALSFGLCSAIAQPFSGDVFISTTAVTIGEKCADQPAYSKFVSVSANTQNGNPTPITVAICRAVKASGEAGASVKAEFEYATLKGGETVRLGCFMPGFNEINVAWVGGGTSKPDITNARNALYLWKSGNYLNIHNVHQYKSIAIKYTAQGKPHQTTLKPGEAGAPGATSLESATYVSPYGTNATLDPTTHCYGATDKFTPTRPFPLN